MGTIEIWAIPTEDADKRMWSRRKQASSEETSAGSLQLIEVEGQHIRTKITELIAEFEGLVTERRPDAKLVVDEIELALTVSANGGVQLITKLEAGAEASIRVKLKRAALAP